jgi:hypothetical protein
VGLTPDRALVPSEFREPPSYSIGLIGYGRQAERIGETALYVLFAGNTRPSEGDFRRPELAIGCVGPRTSYKTSLPGPSPKAVRGG